MRLADSDERPDANALRKHGSAILEQVNALQQFTRRILEKLRPVGLAELGLREALGALLRLWNESHPDVTIETTISPSLGETGETADLTIYRVVQEALTNVFRHAGATAVECQYRSRRAAGGIAGSVRLRAGAGLRQWPRAAAGSEVRSWPDRNAGAAVGVGRHAHRGFRRERGHARGDGSDRLSVTASMTILRLVSVQWANGSMGISLSSKSSIRRSRAESAAFLGNARLSASCGSI